MTMKKLVAVSLLAAAAEVAGGHRRSFGSTNFAFVHPSSAVRQQRITARFANEQDDGDGNTIVKNDFPAWVKALTKWDTSSSSSSSEQPPSPPVSKANDGQKEGISFDSFPFGIGNNNDNRRKSSAKIWEKEMGKEVASLSGMLNVEALMVAANETEEEIDLLLPNINDLRRTIDTETSVYGIDEKDTSPSSSVTKLTSFLDNALKWEDLVPTLQKNILQLTDLLPDDKGLNITFEELVNMVPDNQLSIVENGLVENNKGKVVDTPSMAAEKVLQDAIQPLESLINSTSYAFSPSAFQSLIIRATKTLAIQEASGNLTAAAYNIFQQAGKAPRATAEYTAALVEFANEVLAGGFDPLFSNYPSVKTIPVEDQQHKVIKAAEFGSLSGAIYEESIVSETTALGHSIVAQGKTADIGWMVTDSIQYEQDYQPDSTKKDPTLVRTIVLRGYDASDDEVDREGLLNVICTATPVPIFKSEKALVNVHEGMLSMAQQLLEELEEYIDTTSPSHKFVLTGHSIGGSLSVLLMILLVNSRGADFVRNRVLRVFTFGSPPIFELESTSNLEQMVTQGSNSCSILDAFGLPSSLVYAYNQPWDPIIRLYTKYDPLYPLIDDLGEDGYTLYVNGPTRTLRPILKTILESWEGWPEFRDNAKPKLGQDYRALGKQYLLLPEPIRYLTDRLVSVNTAVPPIESIVQISSTELLPALDEVFKLDVFTISYISVAIRSFVHHFFPAYGSPLVEYADNIKAEE